LTLAGHHRVTLATIDVDFRAHAEVIEIKPWFDREASPWNNPPLVVPPLVLEMRSITMDVFAEAMAGTM